MAQNEPRPNFFLILDLDPQAAWDERAFRGALIAKRRQWSKQRSDGIKSHPATVAAQQNLSYIPQIEQVMLDAGRREEERRAAFAATADQRRQRAARVAERVELLLAKGFLYDQEYESLQGDLRVANDAVRRRAESAERRPARPERKDNERLDRATERNLRDNLKTIKEPDLYVVLRQVDPGISETSSNAALTAAADKLYQKARNTADKSRPEVGARQTLAGLAKTVFGSDELRRRYEQSRRLEPVVALIERYEEDLALVRAIDPRQVEMFLRAAAARGVDVGLAKETFIEHFRDKNWSVEVPGPATEAALKALVSCPRCADLNERGAAHCAACGDLLMVICPRCDTQVTLTASACPDCGFGVDDRYYAAYLADEAEALIDRDDAPGGDDFLRRAERAWPLGPDSDDPLAVRLRQLRERLEPVRERQRQAIEQVSALMENRDYQAARGRLRGLPFSTQATREMLQRCENAVGESERKAVQARQPGLSRERRAALYLEALELCADHAEARRELDQLPPGPPRHLRAKADEDARIVRLAWEPSSDPGCSSVVIRVDAPEPPSSPHGHHRHVVRSGRTWDDRDPVSGRPMWYAVYTERDVSGRLSEEGALAEEPVLLTSAPRLTAQPGDGRVELAWTVPENAVRVEIRREEMATGDLVRFPAADHRAARQVDQDVRNGTCYRYTASAVYAYQVPGEPTAVRRSREVISEVVPAAPPPPPGPLRVTGYPPPPGIGLYQQRVQLDWPRGGPGEIRVVRTLPGQPVPTPGTNFPEAELGKYAEVLRGNDFRWMPYHPPVCYFTPVLLLNGRGYPGETRPYAVGPEVREIRAEHAGTSVIVTWTWPEDVDETLVSWDLENEVTDPVLAELRTTVRRIDGAASGECRIPVGTFRQIFIRVAAVVRREGAVFFTTGAGTSTRHQMMTLAYEIRRGRGQKVRLVLRPDKPAYLPALILVGRTDGRPAGRGDTVLHRIPPGRFEPGAGVDVHLDKTIQPVSVRLVTEEDADGESLTLILSF